jgi:hypothetical protein
MQARTDALPLPQECAGEPQRNRSGPGLIARHAEPPHDESVTGAKVNGGGRKPILARIVLAWEAAQRRRAEEFIRRQRHFSWFY